MSKCKCSKSISVLGDGCRYCQPQEQIDSLADALAEETAKADHAEELVKALELLKLMCVSNGLILPHTFEVVDKALNNYEKSLK